MGPKVGKRRALQDHVVFVRSRAGLISPSLPPSGASLPNPTGLKRPLTLRGGFFYISAPGARVLSGG